MFRFINKVQYGSKSGTKYLTWMTHTKKSATLQSAGIYLILTISNSVMAQNIANLR
jgi:hypothetical protein